jgi:hypothetical protein
MPSLSVILWKKYAVSLFFPFVGAVLKDDTRWEDITPAMGNGCCSEKFRPGRQLSWLNQDYRFTRKALALRP